MPPEDSHPQLFNAGGPVRTGRRAPRPSVAPSHHGPRTVGPCKWPGCPNLARNFDLFYCDEHRGGAVCKWPGCDKPRRRAQAAKYCEDHATMIDGREVKRTVTTPCPGCGREVVLRGQASPNLVTRAWREFCAECRHASPVSLHQLHHHRVPVDLIRRWLKRGVTLGCDICGITGQVGRSIIDTRLAWAYNPAVDYDKLYAYDPARAAALLDEAGLKPGSINN